MTNFNNPPHRLSRYLEKSAGWLDSGYGFHGLHDKNGELDAVVTLTPAQQKAMTTPGAVIKGQMRIHSFSGDDFSNHAVRPMSPGQVRDAITDHTREYSKSIGKDYIGLEAAFEKNPKLGELFDITNHASAITGAKRGGALAAIGLAGLGAKTVVANRRAATIAKELHAAKHIRNRNMLIGGGMAAGLAGLGLLAHNNQ